MKRLLKLALFIAPLFFVSPSYAASYYFDYTNGLDANEGLHSCSEAFPCKGLTATTLDGASALSPGDFVFLKAGEEWCGSNVAEFVQNSNGTPSSHITFARYGTGANPILSGVCAQTYTWTDTGANAIHYTTGQTQSSVQFVSVDSGDADENALNRWNGNNNNLPAGSFCRSTSATAGTACVTNSTGTFVFVRLRDGSDPDTHDMRIGNYVHNSLNGNRGLLRTVESSARGDYTDFIDIETRNTNGVGISLSGYNPRTIGMKGALSAREGMLTWCSTSSGEAASYHESYYDEVSWGAQNGTGSGQGITTYCDNTVYTSPYAHHCAMAGLDVVDAGTLQNTTQVIVLRGLFHNNGLWTPSGSSQDPNLYVDGASEVFIWGAQTYDIGNATGSTGGTNAREGIKMGSEHVSTDVAQNIDVINSYSAGSHWKAIGTDNAASSTANINTIRWQFGTFSAISSSATNFDYAFGINEIDTSIADTFKAIGNIFLADNSAPVNGGMSAGSHVDMDYNQYYRRTGSTTIYQVSGVNKTLAQWQSDSGEDANSAYGDPLFVTDSDTAPDFHLQSGSPARDAGGPAPLFDYQDWMETNYPTVVAEIGPYGLKGTTMADGTLDDVSVDYDFGYHYSYASLTLANVEPVSLSAGASGDVNVTFTMPQYVTALLYNWKIKVTLPVGMSWNSGGTTAISNVVGPNGTFTLEVGAGSDTDQVLTITRVGDGYSTFPTTVSFTLSHVGNPSSGGAGGTYTISTTDENDIQIATATPESDTFASPDPTGLVVVTPGGSFTVQGTITITPKS